MYQHSVLNEVRTDRGTLADTTMPILAIAYSLKPVKGETLSVQNAGATITISPTGGTGSKLLVTITKYVRTSAGVETSSASTLNGATYTTLKLLIDALNAIEGIKAWALHAPHGLSTDSDNFIALAETDIPTNGDPLETMYRDISEADGDSNKPLYIRIGNPEARDSGRMKLLSIKGTLTGVTSGGIKLYRDAYGETEEELLSFAAGTTAVLTSHLDHNQEQASVYRGPLLLKVYSTDATAADYAVRTINAEN